MSAAPHEDAQADRAGRIGQRGFAALWLLACVVLATIGWHYRTDFSYEPVGPRAYPLLCLALMGLGLAWLIARPPLLSREDDDAPVNRALIGKIALCTGLLFAYAGLFEPLGFIVSSALAASAMALLSGGRLLPSVVAGTSVAIALYVLFDRVLEVPLPPGVLAPLLA